MIEKDEVRHIAGLARIGLSEKDVVKFSTELSAVLDWIRQLEEVKIEDVQPMDHVGGKTNVLRQDKVEEFPAKDEIIGLFPEKKNDYAKVRSVL